MKKEDFIFTNCRELAYEAESHREKSSLYGLDCLLLNSNHSGPAGMNSMVAYIVAAKKRPSLEDAKWDMYFDIETIDSLFHINYEGSTRDYLCEILEEHPVIILEEERSYLRPQTEMGANHLEKRELSYLINLISNPKDTDGYHFGDLPKAYENYGRAVLNNQLFMSGLKT